MLARTGVSLQIDPVHARAICDEIGDRLRGLLRRQVSDDLPSRLRYLLQELAKADHETAPSIAPSLDELMTAQGPANVSAWAQRSRATR